MGIGGKLVIDFQVKNKRIALPDRARHVTSVIPAGIAAFVLQEEVVIAVCVILILICSLEGITLGSPFGTAFIGSNILSPTFLV